MRVERVITSLFVFFGLSTISTYSQKIEFKPVAELHEQEIAAQATATLSQKISDAAFLICTPRESFPFPKSWSSELKENVFAREALSDLMKCSPKKCAFNFLRPELEVLERLEKPEDFKNQFIQFYQDRVDGKTGLDTGRTPYFFRTGSTAEDFCPSPSLKTLIDNRPVKGFPFRLSLVRYNPRMRQTTRLLQGTSYPLGKNQSGVCYAEALLFSDHYDLDRLEVWKLERMDQGTRVSVQVRHRIDLLNSWFRRLNKGALKDELKDLLEGQMKETLACLQNQSASQ